MFVDSTEPFYPHKSLGWTVKVTFAENKTSYSKRKIRCPLCLESSIVISLSHTHLHLGKSITDGLRTSLSPSNRCADFGEPRESKTVKVWRFLVDLWTVNYPSPNTGSKHCHFVLLVFVWLLYAVIHSLLLWQLDLHITVRHTHTDFSVSPQIGFLISHTRTEAVKCSGCNIRWLMVL